MAGQSINDRLTAARYSIAGQGLAKSVCKATTEEVIGPKKKHLDYLLQCTNEPNVSIPQLANLLIERTQSQAWVIVFKALITVHTLMCYGNERFTQYLASSNCKFNLSGFLDKTGTTDQPQLSYDMSTFIRRYAKYINEKAISYRTVAFDFCKVKRGKNEGTVRTMNTDTLLKTLPVLQQHLDALLDFDCTASELNNGVINAGFMLLFRDLIRLFACYNDGIINLLEKYFDMNKKQCRDALDCYKKFLIRMDRVSEFLKVAETVGMDKSEIPDLKQAPSSLLEALEGHLASLEGKKPPIPAAPSGGSGSNQFESVLTALSSTSASFGLASSHDTNGIGGAGASSNGFSATVASAASGGFNGTTANGAGTGLDEVTKQQALADEEAMYAKIREDAAKNNPFLSSPSAETAALAAAAPVADSATIIDLFAAEPSTGPDLSAQVGGGAKASADLLQLSAVNPFADMMAAASGPSMQQQPYTNGLSQSLSATMLQQQQAQHAFVSDNAFAVAFGGLQPTPSANTFDGFGDILQPESGPGGAASQQAALAAMPTTASAVPAKLISGDLDSSLSSLVDNLNIKGPASKPQWQSPKTPNKTGGANWAPPQPTTGNFARPQQPPPPQQQWVPGAPMAGGMMAQPPVMAAPAPAGGQAMPAAFDPFGAL